MLIVGVAVLGLGLHKYLNGAFYCSDYLCWPLVSHVILAAAEIRRNNVNPAQRFT